MAQTAQAQRKPQARDWPFEVKPLHPALGCEISGITLAQAVEPKMFGKVYEAFLDYELILFRGVDLPPATQVAFAKSFGEVQIHVMNQYQKYPEHPEIYMLTNADKDGKPTGKHPDKGTLHWHTDGSWRERTGQATMMYSEIVPPAGGETEFADMYSAYDNLPAEMKKRIEGKRAIHNPDFSRTRRHGEDPMTAEQKAKVPPIAHPIVRTHPETGRKAIFLGDHAQEDRLAAGLGVGAHDRMRDRRYLRLLLGGHRVFAVATCAREVGIVDRSLALDPLLHLGRQIVISRIHVGEFGLAAGRRHDLGIHHRRLPGPLAPRAVGVPVQRALVGMLAGRLAVLVGVGEHVNLGMLRI